MGTKGGKIRVMLYDGMRNWGPSSQQLSSPGNWFVQIGIAIIFLGFFKCLIVLNDLELVVNPFTKSGGSKGGIRWSV